MKTDLATLFLRLALSAGLLSAVFSRLGWLGKHSTGWSEFIEYTARVNSFAPKALISPMAIAATILESLFAIGLLVGYKTSFIAYGTSILTFMFGLAMTYSFGLKEPLDYSVFAFSAAAFLLASMPAVPWTIDQLIR